MTKTSEYIQRGITKCIMILTGSITCTSYTYRIMAVTGWLETYSIQTGSEALQRDDTN